MSVLIAAGLSSQASYAMTSTSVKPIKASRTHAQSPQIVTSDSKTNPDDIKIFEMLASKSQDFSCPTGFTLTKVSNKKEQKKI